jgi:Disulphide bond corrector protein DsbC
VQKFSFPLATATLLLTGALALAQKLPWQTNESGEQQPQSVRFLYPEQITLAPGKETEVDLHFRVSDGLHINSHVPRDKSLIPTQLIVAEPSGLKISAVDFPPGTDYAFAATPNDKLSIYTGEFVLHAHITAQPGDHLLQGVLRYQACDTNSCYPPRKAPVAIDVIAK